MRPDRALVDAGVSPYEQVFRTDYVIERGGKRERRVEQATLAQVGRRAAAAEHRRGRSILDVENAFTDVQLAKLNLALAQDNLEAFNSVVADQHRRVANRRPVAGRAVAVAAGGPAVPERRAPAGHQAARRAESAEHADRPRRRRRPLDVAGDLRGTQQPRRLRGAAPQALDARPDLRAARTDQARSIADLRLQLANGKIDYTVSGEYHRQEGAGVHGNCYGVCSSARRCRSSTAIRARSPAPELQQQQLAPGSRRSKTTSPPKSTNAYAEYSTARRHRRHDRAARCSTQAQDVRTTTEYSYRAGEASFVEFLDAVRAFNDTMQSYNEARAELRAQPLRARRDLRQGEPMKRPLAVAWLSPLVVLCAGCSGSGFGASGRRRGRPPTAHRARSIIPADSPMLKQITRQPVGVADLPTDEVVAPGKIEANPNRISKVVLPVGGRITSVLVKTGDAVAQGSAAADDPEPGRRRGDVDVPVGAGVGDAGARRRSSRRRPTSIASSDLFEHNAVAKKDVLSAESALAQAKAAARAGARALTSRPRGAWRCSGSSQDDIEQEVVLRSPLSGKVLELSVVPGEFRNDTSASRYDDRRSEHGVGDLAGAGKLHPVRPGRRARRDQPGGLSR